MVLFPPCKINLGLKILFKRPDRYHEIDTCMYEIPIYDILEIIPSEEFQFTSSGLIIPGETDNNLCVKAFNLIQKKHKIQNVKIHLHKQIPMGGGLGGGSSNGTNVLKGLNELFNLSISDKELETYAAELGSDCPFFVKSKSQISQGRGEILTEINIDLNGYYLRILNIGIHVSTADAYTNVTFDNPSPTVENLIKNINLKEWKYKVENNFEKSIFLKHPILKQLKNELYNDGAIYASMSGSGSTMYGIYESKPDENKFSKYNPEFEIIVKL
jgi:4-diphosphocytidyl-2-C-methyl-D-erythritol kinase